MGSKENCSKLAKALAPPNTEGLLRLCNQGYNDAMRYLQTQDIIRCEDCLNVNSQRALNMSDHVPENTYCDICRVIKEEALTKTLPLEIREVFDEEIERESKQPRGAYSSILSLVLSLMWSLMLHIIESLMSFISSVRGAYSSILSFLLDLDLLLFKMNIVLSLDLLLWNELTIFAPLSLCTFFELETCPFVVTAL